MSPECPVHECELFPFSGELIRIGTNYFQAWHCYACRKIWVRKDGILIRIDNLNKKGGGDGDKLFRNGNPANKDPCDTVAP